MPYRLTGKQTRKLCFFKLLRGKEAPFRVRFGFSKRPHSQIEIAYADWSRVSKSLTCEGYEMVSLGEEQVTSPLTDSQSPPPPIRIVQ